MGNVRYILMVDGIVMLNTDKAISVVETAISLIDDDEATVHSMKIIQQRRKTVATWKEGRGWKNIIDGGLLD